jgi:hypothetical protein
MGSPGSASWAVVDVADVTVVVDVVGATVVVIGVWFDVVLEVGSDVVVEVGAVVEVVSSPVVGVVRASVSVVDSVDPVSCAIAMLGISITTARHSESRLRRAIGHWRGFPGESGPGPRSVEKSPV